MPTHQPAPGPVPPPRDRGAAPVPASARIAEPAHVAEAAPATGSIGETEVTALAARVAAAFAALPEVVAVALGGSRGAGGVAHDRESDVDVEVYTRSDLPRPARERAMVAAGARLPLPADHAFWGAADEWCDAATGLVVDATYFDASWMAEQLDRVLVRHEASLGYSTCFWHTIRGALPLHDPDGWLAALQDRAAAPYPDELRRAIVVHNRAALRGFPSAWEVQVAKAARRGDAVAVNHRIAGLLASSFDLVFALDRVPHPGEKRLLAAVVARCPNRPAGFEDRAAAVLEAAADAEPGRLESTVAALIDGIDAAILADPVLAADPEVAALLATP